MIAFLKLLVMKMMLLNLIFFSLCGAKLAGHVLNSSRKISNKLFEISSTTMDIIFSKIWLLYYILFSPQVKRGVIIRNKHGIYELPHRLMNNLGSWEIKKDKKISKLHRIIT